MKFCRLWLVPAALSAVASVTLLDAKPSKAMLFIDFIPISSTQTRIQATGQLNRSTLGTAVNSLISTNSSGNNSASISVGNNPPTSNDQLRFTYDVDTSENGKRYGIVGETNPFRGTPTSTYVFTGTPPAANPLFLLRFTGGLTTFGGSDFWLADTYVNDAVINSSFIVNASLSQIGLFNDKVVYDIGTDKITLQSVPGPLPVLSVAAAFGFSRKMRKRIRGSNASKSPMTGSAI